MTKPKWQTADAHGETWHEYGPTRETARRLYIKYPLLSVADIARMLTVSRQAIDEYVRGLKEERERLHANALARIRKEEGL
jgi:predicted transcriptional regulator